MNYAIKILKDELKRQKYLLENEPHILSSDNINCIYKKPIEQYQQNIQDLESSLEKLGDGND